MKVENMISRNGNKVANQFLINDDKGVTFQSYDTVIARRNNDGTIVLDDKMWDYSQTTVKYLGMFLGMNKKEITKSIKGGDILLQDLN